MSVAIAEISPSVAGIGARIVGAHPPIEAHATRIGYRGAVLNADTGFAEGDHVWVELNTPLGMVRPLAEVVGLGSGWLSVRYVHLFPDHRRTLESHLATEATASGY